MSKKPKEPEKMAAEEPEVDPLPPGTIQEVPGAKKMDYFQKQLHLQGPRVTGKKARKAMKRIWKKRLRKEENEKVIKAQQEATETAQTIGPDQTPGAVKAAEQTPKTAQELLAAERPGTFQNQAGWDGDGNPTGGFVAGIGYTIVWQDGPRVDEAGRLRPPNGATLEDIFEVLLYRLETFEKSIYACGENKTAIAALRMGLKALRRRRERRAKEGKLGRYQV